MKELTKTGGDGAKMRVGSRPEERKHPGCGEALKNGRKQRKRKGGKTEKNIILNEERQSA